MIKSIDDAKPTTWNAMMTQVTMRRAHGREATNSFSLTSMIDEDEEGSP